MFSQIIDQMEQKNNWYNFGRATWCYKPLPNVQLCIYYSCWILSLCTAIKGCISEFLFSMDEHFQVQRLLIKYWSLKSPKTTYLDNGNESTQRLFTFTFMLHGWSRTAGHYPEESTILGKNPLKELTPAAWCQTLFTKIKASPPLHLQPPWAPPAGLSTSPPMLLKKKSKGPPSWKDFRNYLPTSYIASSQHGRHPSRFSCS